LRKIQRFYHFHDSLMTIAKNQFFQESE
jgi:hypothetical protein